MSVPSASEPPVSVVVATYNVHDCIGRDGRYDPERVLTILRELDADLLALQELQWEPEVALDVLQYFASQLHYRAIPGATLLRRNGHYGNAILTRLPVERIRRVDLSLPRREPRGAIEVVVDTPCGPLSAIGTHLGLLPGERHKQMLRLLKLLAEAPDPALLFGDLNEWFVWGRPLRWLRAHFGHTPDLATYPAVYPLFPLDRIWVKPNSLLAELKVHATPLARETSDHLPLRAVLDCCDNSNSLKYKDFSHG
jgi:endonuclease/exonuclease/phosphatase family metal-dependent hydrolase